MSQMIEMAKELGKLLAQTDEYQILKVTVASSGGDKEISDLREELSGIEDLIGEVLHAGDSPDDDLKSKYEDVANRLQPRPRVHSTSLVRFIFAARFESRKAAVAVSEH